VKTAPGAVLTQKIVTYAGDKNSRVLVPGRTFQPHHFCKLDHFVTVKIISITFNRPCFESLEFLKFLKFFDPCLTKLKNKHFYLINLANDI
jgi:hypothetical protein